MQKVLKIKKLKPLKKVRHIQSIPIESVHKFLLAPISHILSSPLFTAIITVGPISSTPIKTIQGIVYPTHVATGCNGEIVVASYTSSKIHVYSGHDFELLHTFGRSGYMDGQFTCPSGIAIDRYNRILVSSMNKLDIFTMKGQFVKGVGKQGKAPLEFNHASGVVVGKEGEIYIADSQNNRIQVLNSDLSFRTSFSKACPTLGSGCLSQPQAVAINSEGNVYVVDMNNHAVQAFTTEGEFILRFGKYGTTPGCLCIPMALVIDREDNVFVGSSVGTISIFDKQGAFLRQFGSYGSELGQFNQIRGMHIDRKGQLYICEWMSNRIQIFQGSSSMKGKELEEGDTGEKSDGEITDTDNLSKPAYLIGPTSSLPLKIITDIKGANGVAESKSGEIIVSSREDHKVYVYDPKNDYKQPTEIGEKGDFDGKFWYPSKVLITPDNLILVCSLRKLQWFTMDGKLVYVIQGSDTDEATNDIGSADDIAIGRKGHIYVIDDKRKKVHVLNGDATYNRSFGFPHLTSRNNYPPKALAVNSKENLYFADKRNHCVHTLSSSGEYLFKFGKCGPISERGTLSSPTDITIDSEDYVFVASTTMVSIFDKSGSFIRAFGGQGSEPGQFSHISGLHISKNGHFYVSEFFHNRVQIFECPKSHNEDNDVISEGIKTISSHRPLYTIGPESDVSSMTITGINEPWGVTTAPNGDIYVASKKDKKIAIYDGQSHEFREEISQLIWESPQEGKDMADLSDVAICEDGCLLISIQNQLAKITLDGLVIASIGKKRKRGRSNNDLDKPNSIAVGKDGQIYVADKGNYRVQIFNADLTYKSTCYFPDHVGRTDIYPEKIAVNSMGNIYVTDSKNTCVFVFDGSGRFLFRFGKKGTMRERGSLSSPTAIAIDKEDYVYISESNVGVSIFNKEGCFVRAFGACGNALGSLRDIKAMHIDHSGNLYICEGNGNHRIVTMSSQGVKVEEVLELKSCLLLFKLGLKI